MKEFPRIMTQWFGAALEAYKLKTCKNYIDVDVTFAIHQACEKGLNAINGIDDKQEDAIMAALDGNPLQEVVLSGYVSTTRPSTRVDLYIP